MLNVSARTIPDCIKIYRAVWENVAIPSILYGCEALIWSSQHINELDKIQHAYAKNLLGLNQSTANEISSIELGFRPFWLRILTRKLDFITKHNDHTMTS